jgi:hypothetical protein
LRADRDFENVLSDSPICKARADATGQGEAVSRVVV